MSGRWSWSANPICDVPQVLRRKWFTLAAGPLKWILVGIAAALTAVVAIVPTVREDGPRTVRKTDKRRLPPRDGGKPPFAAV
jgi:hypothetical protein